MITCCNGCVPPKRTTTCHFDGTCPEYIEQKAVHDAELERKNKAKFAQDSIICQKYEGVRRAYKRRKS